MSSKRSRYGLLALLFAIYILIFAYKAHFFIGSDFVTFYETGRAFLHHQPLYAPEHWTHYNARPYQPFVQTLKFTSSENLNPPLVSVLMSPFALGSYTTGFVCWGVVSFCFGLAGFYCLTAPLTLASFNLKSTTNHLLLLLAAFPVYQCLIFGQLGLLVFFMTVLLWRCVRQQQLIRAGIVLGIAGNIKLFFGGFLLYFLFKKQWRLIAVTLSVGSLILAASVALTSVTALRHYVSILQAVTWFGASTNASLYGFLTRLFGGSTMTPLINAPWLTIPVYYAGLGGLLYLMYALLIKQAALPEPYQTDLGIALATLITLLMTPLGWVYYFPMLYLVVYVILFYLERQQETEFSLPLALLGGALFFISFPCLLIATAKKVPFHTLFWSYSFGFYALMLLLVAVCVITYRSSSTLAQCPARPLSVIQRSCLGVCVLPSALGLVALLPQIFHVWMIGK